MSEQIEKNPLLYNAEEARVYLHLETVETLDTLEKHFGLLSHKAGRTRIYWKRDLDACAYRMVGERPPVELLRKESLKLAQESA